MNSGRKNGTLNLPTQPAMGQAQRRHGTRDEFMLSAQPVSCAVSMRNSGAVIWGKNILSDNGARICPGPWLHHHLC